MVSVIQFVLGKQNGVGNPRAVTSYLRVITGQTAISH